MKPAEAKRLAQLADCEGDAWKAKSIQRLWAGMGTIYELSCGDQRIIAKVVKLPKRCDSVGDRRKAKSYECEAAFYRDGYAAQLLDAGVVVPRPLHVEARSDGVTIVMSRLDGRPGAFDRRGTEAALCCVSKAPCLLLGPTRRRGGRWRVAGTGHDVVRSRVRNVDVPSRWSLPRRYLDTRADEFDSMPTRGWEGRLRLAAKAIVERLKADPMQSVVHGDPKDANFYFAADGTPQLYDFQYCGKACPAKDVALLLVLRVVGVGRGRRTGARLPSGSVRRAGVARRRGATGRRVPRGAGTGLRGSWAVDEWLGLVGQRPRAPHHVGCWTASTAAQPRVGGGVWSGRCARVPCVM